MTTTTRAANIDDVVAGLRQRLGGEAAASAPRQEAPGCWPADPKVTGERAVARHAKDGNPVLQVVAELRRPEVAIPAAAALAAVGAGIAWAVRD